MINKFDLHITALSPINISEPGEAYANPDTMAVFPYKPANAKGIFPCTRTKSIQFLPRLSEGDDSSKTSLSAPRISGNYQRGLIRHTIAEIVREELAKEGKKGSKAQKSESLSFDENFILQKGSAIGDVGRMTTLLEAEKAATNPVVALLGGGPKFIWARLSTADCVAVTNSTIEAGLVPASAAPYATQDKTTMPYFSVKKDDILNGSGSLPFNVSDFAEKASKYASAVLESRNKKSDPKKEAEGEESSKKVSEAIVFATEVVIPGTTLSGTHIIDSRLPGPAAVGLYLLSLERWANKQRLGGKWATGFGRFEARLQIRTENGLKLVLKRLENGDHALDLSIPEVKEAVKSWRIYANEELNATDLMNAFGKSESKK